MLGIRNSRGLQPSFCTLDAVVDVCPVSESPPTALGRTPLYDRANFAENVPQLLRQIEISVTLEEGDDFDGTSIFFSADDAREELERLRKDEQPAANLAAAGGVCALPAQVPALPDGLRVTPEMKQLLSALLTPSHSHGRKLGFCGMGGIGKVSAAAPSAPSALILYPCRFV